MDQVQLTDKYLHVRPDDGHCVSQAVARPDSFDEVGGRSAVGIADNVATLRHTHGETAAWQ